MMVGQVLKGFPRLAVELGGKQGTLEAEFIVDTGFDGDLALPEQAVRALVTTLRGMQIRATADGSHIQVEVHTAMALW